MMSNSGCYLKGTEWKFSEGRQESIFYQLPKWSDEQPDVRMVPQMTSTLIPQDGGWGETKVERCLYFYTQCLHPIKFWSFLYDLVLIISPSRQGSKKNATQFAILLREDETQLEYFLQISSFTEIFRNYSSDKKRKKVGKMKKFGFPRRGQWWPCYFFTASFLKETPLLTTSAYLLCVYVCMCVCSVAQSCLTLCNPLDYNLPGASVHGILRQESWSGVLFPSPLFISYSLLNVPESDVPSYHCPQIVHTS